MYRCIHDDSTTIKYNTYNLSFYADEKSNVPFRNYVVGAESDYSAGEQFCTDNNLQLMRWDTEDKYKDIGDMATRGK